MGYRLANDDHIAAAQMLGARMARDDDQDEQDAAQDATVAYLEAVCEGTSVVKAGRIMARLLAGREPDGGRKRSHHRPLLSRSYAERLAELPEWAL